MSWQAKPRLISTSAPDSRAKPGPAAVAVPSANARVSNGLKEFLWLLSDSTQGRILDLGQVSQATLTFFIEKGFRVSTEDLLRAWKEFLVAEEENFRKAPVGDHENVSPAMFADKFLASDLQYPAEHFHGVLAWDIFDYLDAQLLPNGLFDFVGRIRRRVRWHSERGYANKESATGRQRDDKSTLLRPHCSSMVPSW